MFDAPKPLPVANGFPPPSMTRFREQSDARSGWLSPLERGEEGRGSFLTAATALPTRPLVQELAAVALSAAAFLVVKCADLLARSPLTAPGAVAAATPPAVAFVTAAAAGIAPALAATAASSTSSSSVATPGAASSCVAAPGTAAACVAAPGTTAATSSSSIAAPASSATASATTASVATTATLIAVAVVVFAGSVPTHCIWYMVGVKGVWGPSSSDGRRPPSCETERPLNDASPECRAAMRACPSRITPINPKYLPQNPKFLKYEYSCAQLYLVQLHTCSAQAKTHPIIEAFSASVF